MPLYETVFIARQDISAKQVEDYAKSFSKIVNDNGGDTKRTEAWGLRNLAYKIKKNKKGHYTLLHFDAPAAAIAKMERNIRLNEDVLRFMTVRIEKLPEGPRPSCARAMTKAMNAVAIVATVVAVTASRATAAPVARVPMQRRQAQKELNNV